MDDFWSELKRRNVYRVGVAYAVVGWAIAQVADLLADNFDTPDWIMQTLLLVLITGLPVALIVAWLYEHTPEGVRRSGRVEGATTPRRGSGLTWITSIALAAALAVIAWDRLAPDLAEDNRSARTDYEKSVAVLPFADLSQNSDQEWLADGISEEILNSLARLPELTVIARTSSFTFKGSNAGIDEIASRLGVQHIVEGSVRRIGDELRISAQLIRSQDGIQLWSNTYDRSAGDLFQVQQDVAENIAQALNIVLDDRKRQQLIATGTRDIEAFEAYRRGLEIHQAAHAREQSPDSQNTLAAAKPYFDAAIELDPRFAQPALMRADYYAHQLLGTGAGADVGDVDPESQPDPLVAYRENLDFVIENATSESQRLAAMISRDFLSPSWRRIPQLVEQLKTHITSAGTMPDSILWAEDILTLLDEFPTIKFIAEQRQRSDPLNRTSWSTLMFACLRRGDVGEARDLIDEMKNRFGAGIPHTFNEFAFALATGNRDAIEILLEDELGLIAQFEHFESLRYALRGDAEKALIAAAKYDTGTNLAPPDLLWTYRLLGEDERFHSLLDRIDSAPEGPALLAPFIFVWGAALPFDLDDAPNFKTALSEAGVSPDSLRTASWTQ